MPWSFTAHDGILDALSNVVSNEDWDQNATHSDSADCTTSDFAVSISAQVPGQLRSKCVGECADPICTYVSKGSHSTRTHDVRINGKWRDIEVCPRFAVGVSVGGGNRIGCMGQVCGR